MVRRARGTRSSPSPPLRRPAASAAAAVCGARSCSLSSILRVRLLLLDILQTLSERERGKGQIAVEFPCLLWYDVCTCTELACYKQHQSRLTMSRTTFRLTQQSGRAGAPTEASTPLPTASGAHTLSAIVPGRPTNHHALITTTHMKGCLHTTVIVRDNVLHPRQEGGRKGSESQCFFGRCLFGGEGRIKVVGALAKAG